MLEMTFSLFLRLFLGSLHMRLRKNQPKSQPKPL